MTTYSRYAICSKGHRIEVSFTWDPEGRQGPTDYTEPCPASGCDGQIVGKLPVGADPATLKLTSPH